MPKKRTEYTYDNKALRRIIRETPGKVEDFLDLMAEDTVTDVKLSFGTSPSSPGDPPGVDIGNLKGSIRWKPTKQFERRIMDGVEYGLPLEDGTETIAPRPFIAPAFDRLRKEFPRMAKKELDIE